MPQTRRGFVFMTSLLMLAGMATLVTLGLTRSMTELSASSRYVANQQAFHLAEAGLEAALRDPKLQNSSGNPLTQGEANALIGTTLFDNVPLGEGTYRVVVEDDGTPGDAFVRLVSTGTINDDARQILRATVWLPVPTPQALDYAVSADGLRLVGNSKLGDGALDGSGRVPLHITATGDPAGSPQRWALETPGNSAVIYASHVEFLNPWNQTLDQLCEKCTNPGIFPTTPAPAPVFNTSGVSALPHPSFDFRPYYDKAIEQCQLEGYTQQACRDGTAGSYHHITTDRTITNETLEGMIYVESGVQLTFKGDVAIRGTIVHEGTSYTFNWNGQSGRWDRVDDYGTIDMSSGHLAINSYSPTDIDQDGTSEAAFAPGMAILGGPILHWSNNISLEDPNDPSAPGIRGFVMVGSYYVGPSVDGSNVAENHIGADGLIEGGVIGVWSEPKWADDFVAFNAFPLGEMGPTNSPVWFFPGAVELGNADVQFQALTSALPGSQAASGDTAPRLLLWLTD